MNKLKFLLFCTSLLFFGESVFSSEYKTEYRYNFSRQVTGVIFPDPDGPGSIKFRAERNTYGNNGLLRKVEKGELSKVQAVNIAPSDWTDFTIHSTVTFTYDIWGNKLSQVIKDSSSRVSSISQFSYDENGRLECEMINMSSSLSTDTCKAENHEDSSGNQNWDRVTKYTYNEHDQVLTVIKALGTPEEQVYQKYTYDGLLKSTVSDAAIAYLPPCQPSVAFLAFSTFCSPLV